LRDPLIDVTLFADRSFTGAVTGNLFSLIALSAPEAARESIASAFRAAQSLAPADAESLISRASDAFVDAFSGSSIISGVLLIVAAGLAFLLISKAGVRESGHDLRHEVDENAEGSPVPTADGRRTSS
jgi:hypothetical protein